MSNIKGNSHNGFPNFNKLENKDESEIAEERELLTKIWVNDQILKKDSHFTDDLHTREIMENQRPRSFSGSLLSLERRGSKSENRNGNFHLPKEIGPDSMLTKKENILNHRYGMQLGRELREIKTGNGEREGDSVEEKNEVLLRKKIGSASVSKEMLHLPLIANSPLTSPNGSPALSPRNSFNGSDSSAVSSPRNSPQESPQIELNNSLPKGFRDQFYREKISRSLPGSPILRRSLQIRSSDLSENPLRLRNQQNDPVSPRLRSTSPFEKSDPNRRQRVFSNGSKLHSRRPGTPMANDLKPNLGMGQLSKSLSDLNLIRENDSETNGLQCRPSRLLPSIIN